jgi:tellurite resistance protein TehA-like permease
VAARLGQPGRGRGRALGGRLAGASASGGARGQQVLDAVPPAAGDVVMAFGILSVDLHAVGQPAAAAVSLWLAAGTWLFLAAVLAQRELREPGRLAREARSPATLSAVAGSCVLGTAFATDGYYPVAAALLGLAALAWLLLAAPVLSHWKTPEAGAYFGDQWVVGGAVGISVLACVKVIQAGDALGRLASPRQSLADVPLALWCIAMLWLGPLIATEALRPRLGYDVRRWATVFPLGMYAACSFAVGQLTGIAGISAFARVWTWLAVLVGLVVFAGLIRRSRQVLFATV